MAKACRADLVAVGSRGLGAYKGFLLGSVSDYVANYARCSVLLAKTPPKGRRRFLVALDDSAHAAAVVRWLGQLDLSEGSLDPPAEGLPVREGLPASRRRRRDVTDGGLSVGKFAAWSGSRMVLKALCERKLECERAPG